MHDVKAFVARRELLERCVGRLAAAVVCPLAQGFGLLPITDALRRELDAMAKASPELPDMAPGVVELAAQISAFTPVTYISTEYFGGTGGQDALL